MRTYEILGMEIGEWTAAKVAHMAEQGTSLEKLRLAEREKPWNRQIDPVRLLMEYDAPTIPVPGIEQLSRHVTRIAMGDISGAA